MNGQSQWFVRKADMVQGPYSRKEIEALYAKGDVHKSTLVRRGTSDPWKPLGDFERNRAEDSQSIPADPQTAVAASAAPASRRLSREPARGHELDEIVRLRNKRETDKPPAASFALRFWWAWPVLALGAIAILHSLDSKGARPTDIRPALEDCVADVANQIDRVEVCFDRRDLSGVVVALDRLIAAERQIVDHPDFYDCLLAGGFDQRVTIFDYATKCVADVLSSSEPFPGRATDSQAEVLQRCVDEQYEIHSVFLQARRAAERIRR
jgi:hypothetical protein